MEPFGPSFRVAIQKLSKMAGIEVAECMSSLDAASLARKVGSCLIVCHTARDEDTVRHITMQQLLKQQLSKKQVRILITASLKDPAGNKRLSTQLAAEVLSEPVPEKSLLFKIDRLLKQLPRAGADGDAAGRADAETDDLVARLPYRWGEALALESDCWSTTRDGIKQIAGRWVLRLAGPAPTHGAWKRTESGSADVEAWQWVPADPGNDPFILEQGGWIFLGQKPEYKEGLWNFVGRSPSLGFYFDSECYGYKLSMDPPGVLLLARDSATSVRALQMAKSSEARAAKKAEEEARGPSVTLVEPLELESDFWGLQGRKPSRVVNKWVISLMGPPPDCGRWQRIKSSAAEAPGQESDESFWQWVPTDPEKDAFVKEEGAWAFYGACPKFTDDLWVFVGRKPLLAFFYEGENYGAKIAIAGDGGLLISRDSVSAARAVPLIESSIEKVVMQKREDVEIDAPVENETTFSFPRDYFGRPGGEWESVDFGSQKRKWYVYIPVELLNDEQKDARALTIFWTYFGSAAPKLDAKEWIFRERRPQSHTAFGDLTRPIQKFLTEYFTTQKTASKIGSSKREESADDGDEEIIYVSRNSEGNRAERAAAEDERTLRMSAKGTVAQADDNADDDAEASSDALDADATDASDASDAGAAESEETQAQPRLRKELLEESSDKRASDNDASEGEPEAGVPSPRIQDFEGGREKGETRSDTSGSSGFPSLVAGEYTGDSNGAFPDTHSEEDTVTAEEEGSGDGSASRPIVRRTREGVSFRYRVETFGAIGGEWEMAATGTDRRRWFAYVPVELLNNALVDVRRLGEYWTFFGSHAPKIITEGGQKFYSFRKRKPQVVEKFGSLPKEVQRFFAEYFSVSQARAVAEPNAGRGDAADYNDSAQSALDTLYFERRRKQRECASEVFAFDQPKLRDVNDLVQNGEQGGTGPEMLEEVDPPGPSLSILAMAFLMSELICKTDLDRKRIASRYCQYLSASFGGLRVELWANTGDSWFCAGAGFRREAADLAAARYSDLFEVGAAPLVEGFVERAAYDAGAYYAPIQLAIGGKARLLGALLIGGEQAKRVDPAYARAVARVARGLLISLSSGERAA